MRKAWLLNLALLTAVAVLGWWVYFKPVPQTSAYPLSALQTGAVTDIRIERSGQQPIAMTKKNGVWLITAPVSAQADPFQVERLLAIVDAKASARLDAGELARFDLDRPAAKLIIDGQIFSFGTVSSTSREQYVLTGDAVYTIDLRHGAALPADVTQLIRRRLFAGDEVPASFEMEAFSLNSRDGKWILNPAPADISADDINRWVDQWRLASALRVDPFDRRKPIGEIRMVFKDGRKLALGIIQVDPELILLRPDEQLQYAFSYETARRLMAVPGATAKP